MFTELRITNFKSLRDVHLEIGPRLTLLVGANNTGKSNALACLRLLGETARLEDLSRALGAVGGPAAAIARGEMGGKVAVRAVVDGEPVEYTISFTNPERGPSSVNQEMVLTLDGLLGVNQKSGQVHRTDGSSEVRKPGAVLSFLAGGRLGNVRLHKLYSALRSLLVFDLSVARLRASSTYAAGLTLGSDGTGLAAVLDALQGSGPDLFELIEKEVKAAAPEVKRLTTPYSLLNPGAKVLGVQEQDGRVFQGEEISDGLVLFVGLATAAALSTPNPDLPGPRLLAIEEPERGIHPRRIREVIDYLRRLADRGTQVVLTTHSPLVLDEFSDSPESVLLFDRGAEGTKITKLTDLDNWESLIRGQPLGEVWYSGLLGGVPR